LQHDINILNKELTIDDIKTSYKDVFTGLGCMRGEYDIQINDEIKPVVHPARRVAFTVREPLR